MLELSDFVIPMREGEAAYRLRDAAFLAELDIAVTQRTTEHVVRCGFAGSPRICNAYEKRLIESQQMHNGADTTSGL